MDGVGTFSMAKVLQEYKMMTVITKTTGIEQWRQAVGNGVRLQSVSVCTGTNVMWDKEAQDWITMQEVLKSFPDIKMITVDVANAYLVDDSGEIKLTLWADDANNIKDGDEIKIENGYTNEFKGEVQLTKGKYGKLEVISG